MHVKWYTNYDNLSITRNSINTTEQHIQQCMSLAHTCLEDFQKPSQTNYKLSLLYNHKKNNTISPTDDSLNLFKQVPLIIHKQEIICK